MTNGTVFIDDDLMRKLAEANGPCITVTLNSDENKMPADRSRALKRIRKALEEYDFPAESLLQSIEQVAPGAVKGTQLLFVSPDLFVHAATSAPVAEVISVEEQFQLRQWLPLKNWDQEFYLLALSLRTRGSCAVRPSPRRRFRFPKELPTACAKQRQRINPITGWTTCQSEEPRRAR
jgi:hypothetical protein